MSDLPGHECQHRHSGYPCEPLAQRCAERAAQVERLRLAILNAIPFIPGGNVKANLRDAYDETPPASLASLKAQWQAEIHEQYAEELRQRTQEAVNAKTSQQQP